MHLSPFGEVVQRCWNDLPRHYPHVGLDAFVIMPNHVHGIIAFADREVVGAGLKPAPTRAGSKRHGLPEVMRAFKSFSSRRVNVLRGNPGQSLWQRGYYEHIVRGEESLTSLRKYIEENPIRWALDQENPANRNRRV